VAGFSPSTGLYASILPMIVYALAGTSRQLIIGPDAATCAMIAAVVAPLAAGNSGMYLSFTIALTLLTGHLLYCRELFAPRWSGRFSRPADPRRSAQWCLDLDHDWPGGQGARQQTGSNADSFARYSKSPSWSSRHTGRPFSCRSAAWLVMLLMPRLSKRVPASLVTMILAGLAAYLLRLDQMGVALIGPVASGLPDLEWPDLPLARSRRPGRLRPPVWRWCCLPAAC
jgi:hypothetical protein